MIKKFLFFPFFLCASDHLEIDMSQLRVSSSHRNLPNITHESTADLSELILHSCFRENSEKIKPFLLVYINKHLEEYQGIEKIDMHTALKESESSDDGIFENRYAITLYSMVGKAVQEALERERRDSVEQHRIASERISKRNVALIGATTTIVGALISAGVTIALALNIGS